MFDAVFLLNEDEARNYFRSSSERMCYPTKYAVAHGVFTDPRLPIADDTNPDAIDSHPTCCWWLMNSTIDTGIAYVYYYGQIYYNPDEVSPVGVRPALWINMSK